VYSFYSFILLIMASQESNTTCETLSEAEIFTESEPDELSQILTTSRDTTRDQRIAIKTALLFNVPWNKIRQELHVTNRQIQYANRHRTTPQKKKKCGGNPKVSTPKRQALEAWLLESPSRRHIPWRQIPLCAPEFNNIGEHAIHTAMTSLGYCRRVAKRKGFSTESRVMQQRLDFAREAINWSQERLYLQIFSDEVWAMGGAHTHSFVTVKEDNSDRLQPENLQHKYSKLPAWMFWGTLAQGTKGPCVFFEKEWGNVNSEVYNTHVLSLVEEYCTQNPGSIFMQDNAPAHRSIETRMNLLERRIRWIPWPPYSPDLNLIEHFWNWMKNWIQEHYWRATYDPSKLSLAQLKRIILEAWNAVPNSYIRALYDSWRARCQAVIDANGGPTRY
jgi:transposase